MHDSNIEESLPENLQQVEALLGPIWQSLQRHRVTLALSGALALRGYSHNQVKSLFQSICCSAGDIELKDRLMVVASTFKRFEQGETILEVGALWNEKLLDNEIIKRLTELISRKA
jgi:hypothetical protein